MRLPSGRKAGHQFRLGLELIGLHSTGAKQL
jgi:hypothetical protein